MSSNGLTPIDIAVAVDNLEAFKKLLEYHVLFPSPKLTRLLRFCAQYRDIEYLRAIRASGIDILYRAKIDTDLIAFLVLTTRDTKSLVKVTSLIETPSQLSTDYLVFAAGTANWDAFLHLLKIGVDFNQTPFERDNVFAEIRTTRARSVGANPQLDEKLDEIIAYLRQHYGSF